ncbi:hypothetical protein ACH47C_40825 [Streptomyces rishiriensis]|uniref:hypothetical protein n=1 Tax=Streptomyces rishiriensis TaxID=68264 RepID=UPI0033EB4F8D
MDSIQNVKGKSRTAGRSYKTGPFQLAGGFIANIGQTALSSNGQAVVTISSSVGSPAPRTTAYTRPNGQPLAQAEDFYIAHNAGGATFTPVTPTSSLGIVRSSPTFPDSSNPDGQDTYRTVFLVLGTNMRFEVDAFLSKGGGAPVAVQPRTLVSPDNQVAIVIGADRGSPMDEIAMLVDCKHTGQPIGQYSFNGPTFSAEVVKKPNGIFVAHLSTSTGSTDIPLP